MDKFQHLTCVPFLCGISDFHQSRILSCMFHIGEILLLGGLSSHVFVDSQGHMPDAYIAHTEFWSAHECAWYGFWGWTCVLPCECNVDRDISHLGELSWCVSWAIPFSYFHIYTFHIWISSLNGLILCVNEYSLYFPDMGIMNIELFCCCGQCSCGHSSMICWLILTCSHTKYTEILCHPYKDKYGEKIFWFS